MIKDFGRALNVAELSFRQGQQIQNVRVVRLQPAGGLKICSSFVATAQVEQYSPFVVMCRGGRRVQADRFGKLFQSPGQIKSVACEGYA